MGENLNINPEFSNKVVKRELIRDDNGKLIGEVQYFNEPEDYEDAFKKYYPENNTTNTY
ncbi:MAG: hypothetical protein ABRQ25_16050 [Clostridiaceae bacterium]